ncbi:MAG: hypothetical protein WCI05_09300 [Myxococcales bacterium]
MRCLQFQSRRSSGVFLQPFLDGAQPTDLAAHLYLGTTVLIQNSLALATSRKK